MTEPGTDSSSWALVDEGWGRKAVDFSTLSEPSNCRECVALHHKLGVDAGDRLLDVACGSGPADEWLGSAVLPAPVSTPRPDWSRWPGTGTECDIRVGDMHDLPWDPETFDVVTSFRGIWGTAPMR